MAGAIYMRIPSAVLDLATELERLAGAARHDLEEPGKARLIERIIARIVEAQAEDERILLTEVEAVSYTRGYSAEYLRRTMKNYGARTDPRYRKGELPRHPATQTTRQGRPGGRIKVVMADD
jgi:hypothetical protein